jgi:hypothetical protein
LKDIEGKAEVLTMTNLGLCHNYGTLPTTTFLKSVAILQKDKSCLVVFFGNIGSDIDIWGYFVI